MKPILREIDISLPQELRNSSDYLGGNNNNMRWVSRREYLQKGLDELIPKIDIYMDQGEIIKNEEGHKIVKLSIKDQNFVIKKYQIKGSWHFLRKLFSQTRANTAWKAYHWFNAAEIKTFSIVAVIERYNYLSSTESYLISLFQPGERLDKVSLNKQHAYLIESRLSSFFKRLKWIGFNHGDVKSSNFFLFNKELFVFDLDISKRRLLKFRQKNKIIKDQLRILRSFEENKKITHALKRRFN